MKNIRVLTKCEECNSKDNLHETMEKEVLCEKCLDYHQFCAKCGRIDHQDWMTEIDGEYYCNKCN
jgi:hypothetical protein